MNVLLNDERQMPDGWVALHSAKACARATMVAGLKKVEALMAARCLPRKATAGQSSDRGSRAAAIAGAGVGSLEPTDPPLSERGDDDVERLLAGAYDDLRRIARRYMRQERAGHTLLPTDLVHKAYIRVVELDKRQYESREQFIRVVARYMRNVLVDHARSHEAIKRGKGLQRVDFDEDLPVGAAGDDGDDPEAYLRSLGEALEALRKEYPRDARAIELRFFAGLTIDQVASELGVASGTVKRDIVFARAWLKQRLIDHGHRASDPARGNLS